MNHERRNGVIRSKVVGVAACLVVWLAGCAVPPAERHETPQLELPAGTAGVAVAPDWWRSFNDPKLDALVVEALDNNRDLARAMARIDESRAALRASRANQLPNVGANVSADRFRFGPNAPVTVQGNQLIFSDIRANLSVSYEVDLWSRAANLSAAARDELLASEYARDTLRTALAAQVVQSYAALQSLDSQVVLFGQAVQAQRDSLKLQRMRFNAGDISDCYSDAARHEGLKIRYDKGLCLETVNPFFMQPRAFLHDQVLLNFVAHLCQWPHVGAPLVLH